MALTKKEIKKIDRAVDFVNSLEGDQKIKEALEKAKKITKKLAADRAVDWTDQRLHTPTI